MNRIAITGAAGFIGSDVTEHLVEQGYEVIALTNSSELSGDISCDRVSE